MFNKCMKKWPTSLEYKSKQHGESISPWSEWQSSRKQTINVTEDWRGRDYTVVKKVN
jgi:hypothetical protein